MAQGRVQVDPLRANIALQPAPVQGDTYAPPPRPAQDNRFAQLADALGSFSNSIGNLSATMKPSKEDQQNAIWQAQKRIGGLTNAEAKAEVEAGIRPASEDDFALKATNAGLGMKYGSDRAAEVRQHLATEFDWDHGDPDAYVAEVIKADMEKYGTDRNFGAQYLQQMSSLQGWANDFKSKRQGDKFVEGQKDAAYGVFSTKITEARAAGAKPEDIMKAMPGWYKELGKDGTLGLDYKGLDQELVNTAARLVDTDPDMAMAILETPRTGTDGKPLPAIATKRETVDRYLQIKDQAIKVKDAQAYSAAMTAAVEQGADAISKGQGDLVAGDKMVDLPSGTTKKIEAGTLKDLVEKRYGERSAAIAKQNREDPRMQMKRELNDFSRSHLVNPRIKTVLSGMSNSADIGILQDDSAKANMLDRLHTYADVKEYSEGAVMAHSEAPDRQFAEVFYAVRDGLGLDEDRALEMAITTNRPVTGENLPKVLKFQDELDAKVKGITDTTFGFDPDVANYSTVYRKVASLAGSLVSAGLEPTKALTVAAKAVQKSSTTFNGQVIGKVNGAMPNDFTGTANAFLDTFASGPAKGKIADGSVDRKGLSIRAIDESGDRFVIIDEDGLTVPDDNGKMGIFTLKNMREYEASHKSKADAAAVKAVKDKQNVNQKLHERLDKRSVEAPRKQTGGIGAAMRGNR